MESQDFIHGKTQQHLLDIDRNIQEIKEYMRVHNMSDVESFGEINKKLDLITNKFAWITGFAATIGGIMGFLASKIYSKLF